MNLSDADSILKYEYGRIQVSHQLMRTIWGRDFGPPDPRPYYGPDEPGWVVDGACGYIDCRCCNAWRDHDNGSW